MNNACLNTKLQSFTNKAMSFHQKADMGLAPETSTSTSCAQFEIQ